MSNSHTPGPWEVVDGHYPSMKEIRGPSFKIHIVMGATDLTFQDYLARSADAHLIAAAPDLLEALDGMLEVYGSEHDADGLPKHEVELNLITFARAARAKARGAS